MNLSHWLQTQFAAALVGTAADPATAAQQLRPAADAKFGDYQFNGAMALAKELGQKPQVVAQQLLAKLELADALEPPAVAGPGFINLKFKNAWLAARLGECARDERLGVAQVAEPRRIVIDYSSPNVAKPLHVGHLRSTIIGDSLARLLRFLGHSVIADNHLGDWGTQFGILLYGYKHHVDQAAYAEDPLRELARLYVLVRDLTKGADPEGDDTPADPAALAVLEACRNETAKLHAGDAENYALWQQFMPHCMEEIHAIYRRLDVHFDREHGESFYNPMLADVVADLQAKGIAVETKGAIGIFRDDKPDDPPSLIQKRDGAFTYTATDLATVRYRAETLQAHEALYVVDARQGYHFQNLFHAAKRWGYPTRLVHVSFGSVLGADRKPIKTRDGGAIELGALLDEAVVEAAKAYRALSEVEGAEGGLDDAEVAKLAEIIGIGAVKYADLCQHRTTDYIFQWSKMLAMDGNTATYMQYAYARCRSIFRKGEVDPASLRTGDVAVTLDHPAERALGLQLLRLEEALLAAAADHAPHLLTAYLWDLAKAYSSFFQQCPVLKAEQAVLRSSRLLLCDLTARTLQLVLGLLGIRTVEQM